MMSFCDHYISFFLYVFFNVCEAKYGFITWSDNAVLSLTDNLDDIPPVHVARATYSNDINSTGWAFLELHTTADSSDEKQAYAAGYLEGYLTRDLIWLHWQNMLKGYCYNKTDVCGLIEDFVDVNERYLAEMINANPDVPYWYQANASRRAAYSNARDHTHGMPQQKSLESHMLMCACVYDARLAAFNEDDLLFLFYCAYTLMLVKLYKIQLEGLAVGYNQATSDPYQWLTARDILWINMLGDLDDLAFALTMPKMTPEGLFFGEHCSGLVKLLPDLSDLFTSHVTWNSYQSMLRIQKMYVLNYRTSPKNGNPLPGRKMSFTSYPAFVQSTDDWYITSAALVAAETTIGNSNRTLYELVRPTGQVMEFVRAMVATRLARTGQEWVEIFRQHNSGTYNNQWYIVDYKKFRSKSEHSPGKVEPGLLWVIEQLPGNTEAADLTEELKATSYFPSYNIPYFPRIFNLSGGNERVATFGDWFGYQTNPRARIFQKKQSSITSLASMLLVMRYNDYRHDPLSRCACVPPYSACNAIAARNDLNPANGTYPFRALGHRSHGGTDAKVTSSRLSRKFQFLSVSSPTYNISRGIPPFQWSKFDMGPQISHEGHPDVWMFAPLIHEWEWE